MDEAAAAAAREGVDENESGMVERSSPDYSGTSTEDNSNRDEIFCCWDCGEAFREEAAYLEHRHQHSEKNSREHLDPQSDDLHDTEKYGERTNFCDLCSLSFAESTELHLHVEKHHSQASPKDSAIQMNSGVTKQQTYECPECGKCYGVLGHFLNHQRSHRLASKSVFHELEHLKKKSFQCETCGRNYSRASALDAHRRCHEEKLIKPQNRTSTDSFHIEESAVEVEHSENQTDSTPEKLFKCSCGKAFPALLRLKTHQRFSRKSQCSPENKEKPKKSYNEFNCSECKKTFNGHIAFFNHQRWHANHSDDSANRFSCEECGKVFTSLTFYDKHQRTVHSDETATKSFLHQVCQLQKKAFQCKECGLKFSRASALHSHQLHHTDVYGETEKEAQMSSFPLPHQKFLESKKEEIEHCEEAVNSDSVLSASMTEVDRSESDEDMDSYEPGDFNVQVISASESEDEVRQDQNPDLELLCESDQEGKYYIETEVSPTSLVSKPEMDLKIVQIDFEQAEDQCAPVEAEDEMTAEKHDCPECYRWFSSASSLRVHRMWHDVRKRRQHAQVKQCNITRQDCGQNFTCSEKLKSHRQDHVSEEKRDGTRINTETGEERNSAERLISWTVDDDDVSSGVIQGGKFTACSVQEKLYTCLICGKTYIYPESFKKHQKLHEINKRASVGPMGKRYECPDCGKSFIRKTSLVRHLKNHQGPSLFKATLRCDPCRREFKSSKRWRNHNRLHKENPFWCLNCGKGFKHEKSLDKHLWAFHKKQDHDFNPSATGLNTLSGDVDLRDCDNAEVSDCRESEHHFKLSELSGLDGSASHDESESQNKQPKINQLDWSESNLHKDPEYWEWECVECDMGFDEEAKLHLHYVKHATGELPMPQDEFK